MQLSKKCPNKINIITGEKCGNLCDGAALECDVCGYKFGYSVKMILACTLADPRDHAAVVFKDKPRDYVRNFVLIRLYLWTFISSRYGTNHSVNIFLNELYEQMEPYTKILLRTILFKYKERKPAIDVSKATTDVSEGNSSKAMP